MLPFFQAMGWLRITFRGPAPGIPREALGQTWIIMW